MGSSRYNTLLHRLDVIDRHGRFKPRIDATVFMSTGALEDSECFFDVLTGDNHMGGFYL